MLGVIIFANIALKLESKGPVSKLIQFKTDISLFALELWDLL